MVFPLLPMDGSMQAPMFASMAAVNSTPLRTPLKQRPESTPLKQAQQTPVFDSPSSPWTIPGSKAAAAAAQLLQATTPPPATPKTEPTQRQLFTSPGSCASPGRGSAEGAEPDSPSSSFGSSSSVDSIVEQAEAAASAQQAAVFAAADARHEARLQLREDLGEVNEAIGYLERAIWLHGLATTSARTESWGVALDAIDESLLELDASGLDKRVPSTVEQSLLLRAGVQLKLERHEAAAWTCSAVLVVNPDSVAALYRRGCAYSFCEPKSKRTSIPHPTRCPGTSLTACLHLQCSRRRAPTSAARRRSPQHPTRATARSARSIRSSLIARPSL